MIDLLEKNYSFNFNFKYKNIFSWFYKTFIKSNTWILSILNLLSKVQNIALNEAYLDLLKNKYTLDECYKDLKTFILELFYFVIIINIALIVFTCVFDKNIAKNSKMVVPMMCSSFITLIFSFKFLKSEYKPMKSLWVKTKEDNFRFFNSYRTVCDIIFINELSQIGEGTDFLKISGLISISTLIYDFIMLFFTIDIEGKKKNLVIYYNCYLFLLFSLLYFYIYSNKS